MEQKRLHHFRHLLQLRLQELQRSVKATQQEGRLAQDVHGRDEADRASRSREKELFYHRNTQVRNLLKAIESALNRINDGRSESASTAVRTSA